MFLLVYTWFTLEIYKSCMDERKYMYWVIITGSVWQGTGWEIKVL